MMSSSNYGRFWSGRRAGCRELRLGLFARCAKLPLGILRILLSSCGWPFVVSLGLSRATIAQVVAQFLQLSLEQFGGQ
jgi:hypothetical protein